MLFCQTPLTLARSIELIDTTLRAVTVLPSPKLLAQEEVRPKLSVPLSWPYHQVWSWTFCLSCQNTSVTWLGVPKSQRLFGDPEIPTDFTRGGLHSETELPQSWPVTPLLRKDDLEKKGILFRILKWELGSEKKYSRILKLSGDYILD